MPTVNKYYRPATLYYGLERGRSGRSRSVNSSTTPAQVYPPSASYQSSLVSTAPASLPPTPISSASPSAVDKSDFSPAAFDQLLGSLLAAQQPTANSVSDARPESGSESVDIPCTESSGDEGTQALFDHWLEMLTAFPPGAPDDVTGSYTSPFVPLPADPSYSSAFSASQNNDVMQIPDDMIDPALLGISTAVATNAPSSTPFPNVVGLHVPQAVTTNPLPAIIVPTPKSAADHIPPTPSLINSPSVTATSLTDAADVGPTTPCWDWPIPDAQEPNTAETMKLLDVFAGIDAFDAWEASLPDTSGAAPLDNPAESSATNASAAATPVIGPCTAPSPLALPPSGASGVDQHRPMQETLSAHDREASPQAPSRGAGDAGGPVAQAAQLSPGVQPPAQAPPAPALCPPAPSPAGCLPLQATAPALGPALGPAAAPIPAEPAGVRAKETGTEKEKENGKGKGKAVAVRGAGAAAAGAGAQDRGRKAVLERARAMRAALAAEVERAKVALWETTLEQGVLVGLGRELEKEKESGVGGQR